MTKEFNIGSDEHWIDSVNQRHDESENHYAEQVDNRTQPDPRDYSKILNEKCPNCPAVGSVQLMMNEPICSECLKPWIKPKRNYSIIVYGSLLAFWFGFIAYLILK